MSENYGCYIHIPFCLRKCPYCDFYSISDLSLYPGFVRALLTEIKLRQADCCIDTIYFGGGTPSLADPGDLEKILFSIHENFNVAESCDITLEVNPGALPREFLRSVRSLGVNRLNIGVQSFNDDKLRFLNRIHSAGDAEQAILTARASGFDNIGIDIIYGVPGEEKALVAADLNTGLRFFPEHLSCYMLTFEPGTPFYRRMTQGRIHPLDEASSAALFKFTSRHLEKKGYLHYEISNFAHNRNLRSRHNRKYWHMAPYIGLGPSAHSFDKGVRSWNFRDVIQYTAALEKGRLPVMERESISREQKLVEMIMLGLRTSNGVDIKKFEALSGQKFSCVFDSLLKPLMTRGLGGIKNDRFSLTLEGMLLLDSIVSQFADKIL
ncbi:MAG: radical SAM family heme chaperone HemW [Desulfobacteraceae bacterium]